MPQGEWQKRAAPFREGSLESGLTPALKHFSEPSFSAHVTSLFPGLVAAQGGDCPVPRGFPELTEASHDCSESEWMHLPPSSHGLSQAGVGRGREVRDQSMPFRPEGSHLAKQRTARLQQRHACACSRAGF